MAQVRRDASALVGPRCAKSGPARGAFNWPRNSRSGLRLPYPSMQPREPCEEFQELMCLVSLRPIRSWWPTMADPSLLFVQFPQVVSPPAVE
jgi:hypothetical protein